MQRDLVIGIDASTTATKAIAWTRNGTLAAECRASVPLDNPGPNLYEQDPADWWDSARQSVRGVVGEVDARRVAAVAVSNQRETFVPLDADGRAVRPAIIWLDQRAVPEVRRLAEAIGERRIHELTGKPVDVAPVAYRLAWMRRNEPDLYRRTSVFADVHGYLTWRLTGAYRTSWASADPLGLFDMRARQWSAEVLEVLGLTADRLPEAMAPGTVLGEVTRAAAEQTGLIEGTPVVAGGGDGQAAGLGVDSLIPERAYLNLGTAAVSGIYSREYRTGLAWRTMGSCSGEGYYYETSLRTGTFLVDWFVRKISEVDPSADPGIYRRLEEAAAGVPVGSRGLLLVPYWGAVMTPYWDANATGTIIGLTGTHGRAEIYRALLEGVALEQALVTGMIEEETGIEVKELVAIGGGAASDLWCEILAAALGKRLLRSATVEASSLGAGICAAVGAGWFDGFEAAAESMAGRITREFVPGEAGREKYGRLLEVYRRIYPRLQETYAALAALP